MGVPTHITVQEIRKPELDAQLVAEGVAQQLERRIMFRRAMKRAVGNAMRLGALGIKVQVSESDPSVASLTPIWRGMNWHERECWDLYGIRFTGHPNLKRVLMYEEFVGHPLRKDYPLQGRGERHNFPTIARADA